ncbi:MAG: trypsin-like peptidase domain-containing protein [bacterium]
MDTNKKIQISIIVITFLFSSLFGAVFGFLGGTFGARFLPEASIIEGERVVEEKTTVVKEESAVIEAVQKASPAVVSIIATKNVAINSWEPFANDFFNNFFPFGETEQNQSETEKKEIGGGTGFIVSEDGLILTNRHVVSDTEAEYTVLMNDGTSYSAKILARDDTNDLAVLKIDKTGLPTAELGDSDSLQIGQTVITIGNALGEFRNTVSVGVISGLSRSITAGGSGISELLSGVVQTDAAINPGNSGGPLINIKGQVIGINTAIVQGAQNIGFAIPINDAKLDIESVKKFGEIKKPFLGVQYVLINSALKDEYDLAVDKGALIRRADANGLAVVPGSAADKAGILENDIILEVDGKEVNQENSLGNLIQKKKIGESVRLKVLSKGKEKIVDIVLGERISK